MNRIYKLYCSLSKQVRDSIITSVSVVGLTSTVLSILGISLDDWKNSSVWMRVVVFLVAFVVIYILTYFVIGKTFGNSVSLLIRQTPVSICCGDIFETSGWRVIGCDTHFDTRVDDVIISKNSLHGQLILEHSNKEDIKAIIDIEAKKLGLHKNDDGLYNFPLGTVIRYDSSIDNNTYLMLAMTELNARYESHTNMAKFESMLMKMWREIDRVYASNDVVLPVLGNGISRFDDGPKKEETLLRCMLCTLNSSGVSLNSNVKVMIYSHTKDIPLYEYKDMFRV